MSIADMLCHDVLERVFDRLEGRDIARLNGTGDGRMQDAVARCAKSVRFNMPHFARFPSLAISLPKIRALKVETRSAHGAYPLKRLPVALPTSWFNLTRLSLNYRQSFSALPLLRPLSSLTHLSCKGSATPLSEGWEANLPPNLTTLKLFTSDRDPIFTICERLPLSLRCLKTDAFSLPLTNPSMQPIPWPPLLERMSLYKQRSTHSGLDSLPPHLKRFDFTLCSGWGLNILASRMPASLIRIKCPESIIIMDCPSLPPNLQVCSAEGVEIVHGVVLAQLPRSLQCFEADGDIFTQSYLGTSYKDLPNLTFHALLLETEDQISNVATEDLSHCKFKQLYVFGRAAFNSVWRFKLPTTIKTLIIDSSQLIDETIAKLHFPYGLTRLHLMLACRLTLEAWQSLPPTIINLDFATGCSTAPAVELLRHLPPRLETLYVTINSTIAAEDAFRYMPSDTLKSLSVDFRTWSTSSHESWFESIVTCYKLENLFVRVRYAGAKLNNPSAFFSHLSVTLRAMTLLSDCNILSTDCIKHLPRQLTALNLEVSHVIGDVSEFASLPPSLESFRLKQLPFAAMPVEKVVDFMPPGIIKFDAGYLSGPTLEAALSRYYSTSLWRDD